MKNVTIMWRVFRPGNDISAVIKARAASVGDDAGMSASSAYLTTCRRRLLLRRPQPLTGRQRYRAAPARRKCLRRERADPRSTGIRWANDNRHRFIRKDSSRRPQPGNHLRRKRNVRLIVVAHRVAALHPRRQASADLRLGPAQLCHHCSIACRFCWF